MSHHAHTQQALAACQQGAMCIDDRPGPRRDAHAAPAGAPPPGRLGGCDRRRDAEQDGTIDPAALDDGAAIRVWHHIDRSDLLTSVRSSPRTSATECSQPASTG